MKLWMAVAAMCGLILTGCDGSGSPTASAQTAPSPAPAATTTPGQPTERVTPGSVLELGKGAVGQYASVKVIRVEDPYKQPGRVRVPVAGQRWLGLRVVVCRTKAATSTFAMEWGQWSVAGPGGTHYTGSASTYQDYPVHQIPSATVIRPGDCVNGWIVVAVPDQVHPRTVGFAPAAVEWRIP